MLSYDSFFRVLPVSSALLQNPLPKLWVDRVLLWHAAVAKFHLELGQLLELVAPFRVKKSLIIRSFILRCIGTWLFLMLALASSLSLPRPLFGLLFVTLAHGES